MRRRSTRATTAAQLALILALTAGGGTASAGPPFRTDDPEPVPEGHWEVFEFSTATHVVGDTAGTRPALGQLTVTILARPLFSPTRRPAEAAATDHSETPLSDLRLTGILITPDQHLAIFAPAGGKPLVRAEGDMISDWRIESIASQSVSLTGPTGATTLEPKADPNLVRVPGAQQAAAAPPQPAAPATNPQPAPAANAPVRPPIPIRRSNR